MENTTTIAQVVQNVVSTAGIISAASIPFTFGFIQALKSIGLKTRFIGIITIVVGFFVAILFGKLIMGSYFSTFNIAVGVFVGFGTPGAYSAIKALKGNKDTE